MKGLFTSLVIIICSGIVFANSAPSVNEVTANQRTDGSGIVDIYYTLSDADGDNCSITVEASNDGGSSYNITPTSLSGDLANVSSGRRHIIWNSKADLPGEYGTNYRVKVTADDGYVIPIIWVTISDPGFNGQMSKYETTNAQYCQYLNEAKASGDITLSGSIVLGASGAYSGQVYYYLSGPGDTYNGATNGGAARINYNGSSFTVDSGFENHPVTYVSWYGSTAFASYYGYRLPTEWEWQAVADYDGTYTYGHGPGTITNSLANYRGSTHPYGTTTVGAYGSIHGYGMCDMAGNVWELTNSIFYFIDPIYPSLRVTRGGSWFGSRCTVSFRSYSSPGGSSGGLGFRVCR